MPNSSSLEWVSLSSAANSSKSDMCAKFQLSRLIFIFISCQQLLSAVDSWSAVENYFWLLDSHIGPKVGLCAKFQFDWLIGGLARECDARRQTPDRRQVKIMLTPALLGWCQGLSWAIMWIWKEFDGDLTVWYNHWWLDLSINAWA